MRIRMVDKSKANFGNIITCNAAAAQALIIMGAAESYPYASFRERLKAESENRSAQPGDTPAPVLSDSWGVVKKGPRDEYFIQQVRAGETILYEGIPAACPDKVKDQYLRLKGNAPDPEAVRIAKCEESNRQQKSRELEQAGLNRLKL